MITLDQLQVIMPYARSRAAVYLEPLNAAMVEFDINTRLRIASFLAQVCHESGSLRYTCEIASGRAYDRRSDLGNTRPEAQRIAAAHGSTTGQWWCGHGLIQITGYDNHRECGDALGLDLLNDPGLLTSPLSASRSAAWFWKSRRLNELADTEQFERITRRINGGLNGYADRLSAYARAKGVL